MKRDEEFIQYARKEAVRFWNENVLAKVPPPLKDASDARKMLDKFDGLTVPASEDIRATLRLLSTIKEEQKALEAQRESLENAVKIALATGLPQGEQTPGNIALVDAAGKPLATWNEQRCRRLSVGLVQERHPLVAAECTVDSVSRVLRVKVRNL